MWLNIINKGVKEHMNASVSKRIITAALIGNPNVGKTTLFNLLTGSNQHVGNWPGVTVEKKEGFYQR
jgi:Ferrous iron transport protein B.